MKGYPLNTLQTVLVFWGGPLVLFVLWAIVIPEIVGTVRKVRADRAWLRARAARKARGQVWDEYPAPDPESGPLLYVYQVPDPDRPDPSCPLCQGSGVQHCGLSKHEEGRGCGEPCACPYRITALEAYRAYAEANRQADPAWFTPVDRLEP